LTAAHVQPHRSVARSFSTSGLGIGSCLLVALLAEVPLDLAPLPVLSEDAADATQDAPVTSTPRPVPSIGQ
jgi:hypothetical protein